MISITLPPYTPVIGPSASAAGAAPVSGETAIPPPTAVATPEATPVEQQPDNSLVMRSQDIEAKFEYNSDIHRVIITLKSTSTGEVLRQIPSEHVMQLLQGVMDLAGSVYNGRG